MPDSRNLEIVVTEDCGSNYKIKVLNQTHRRDTFTPSGHIFTASSGFSLRSSGSPDFGPDHLYVRGSDGASDENPILIPKDRLDLVLDAIAEYNKTFGNTDTVSLKIQSDEPISLRMDA